MKRQQLFRAYAVRVEMRDGRFFLAHSNNVAPATFSRFKDAVAYRKELRSHLLETKLKVVKVEGVMTWKEARL